ncbi:MAG: hypothetical protein L0332_32345 [Chloroflexi bacterium]|nr:hypothetical protein [Chloroflexota bacterium]MCI0650095.1 hypothetical protein [Chloroflexota bacterium]MCI0731394.1 hypothetical protein [Chloroflexota bacterium]
MLLIAVAVTGVALAAELYRKRRRPETVTLYKTALEAKNNAGTRLVHFDQISWLYRFSRNLCEMSG